MSEDDLFNDRKYIVSMRLSNADRIAVRSTAARLFVRESKLYRFAVHHLLNRLHKLHDDNLNGSDLLLLFLEFKEELSVHLELNKYQMFKILNGKTAKSEKFVAMADIELLLLPKHTVRNRLMMMPEAVKFKHANTIEWMRDYFIDKYQLTNPEAGIIDEETFAT